jgi:menaquinone-dependent protoporphyrinogen oxidase
MTRHILIVYGSRYGQTAKIASYLEDVLVADGLSVTLVNADRMTRAFDLRDFDGVVVGSSVIGGKHRRSVARFVRKNIEMLNRVPTAFFSVSGSAGSPDARSQAEARELVERFVTDAAWKPDLMTAFGGAIAYTQYSPILRWVMKRIARKEGGPTDTTHDHEMTNWEHVEDFAHQFSRIVSPTPSVVASQAHPDTSVKLC